MQTERIDFSNVNIVDCLRHYGERQPDHPAMEDGERVITYQELNLRTDEAAVNIRASGISAGDIVTVILDDSIEHLIVICGLARTGAVIFSLNPALANREIAEGMTEIGSKTLVADKGSFAFSDINIVSKEEICDSNGQSFGKPGACGDQPFVLIQSSGTTGTPKSFTLSHANCLHRNKHDVDTLHFNWRDRYVCLSSMCFHICRAYFLCLLGCGATVVLARDRSPGGLVGLINGKAISFLKIMPNNLFALLKYADGRKLLFPGLRAMSSGSAPITSAQRRLARERLADNFLEEYGSNEMGTVSISLPRDQDLYSESVGRIIAPVEAQIVDNSDQELPFGEAGLARFRCAGMTKKYINNPTMNARHFRHGWFYPGDVAKLNEDRYLFLLGRADDVINNAGVKFYPIEVENVLKNHPAVREAAVFPWPHKLAGQVAGAAVVLERGVTHEQLKKYCAERLAPYKVPYVIAFTKALPKNAMGKVLKRELAKQIQAQSEGSNEDRL
jgi:acyl-coenzyme A synthetase/AMP-(fatty) acid ligase